MVTINVRGLSFGYAGKPIFTGLSANFDCGEPGRPLVILGPSGSGKTTLLKLLGGLLAPQSGSIFFSGESGVTPNIAFMFQEPRLLPWKNIIENIALPIEKIHGKTKAREIARRFLSLVALEGNERKRPAELSGGESQRVSMARAFAWPAPVVFMDEPFQSLDIPLRKNLMDLTLSLLEKKPCLLVAVTHDPREAVYLGGRVIVLGRAGEGIVLDRNINLPPEQRTYGSAAASVIEKELIEALGG